MRRRSLTVAAMLVVALAMFVAGCGGETSESQPATTDSGSAAGGDTSTGSASGRQGGQTEAGSAGGGSGEQVSVGGYTVGGGGLPETSIPEVMVDQAEAQRYLNQVRPIVQNTARDVTDTLDAEPRLENGNLTLNLDLDAVEDARNSARQGLQELQDVQTPEGLGPINQQLTSAYEDVIPAYNDILEAARGGDAEQTISAIQDNLPRVEVFGEEVNSITQDLDQATGQ